MTVIRHNSISGIVSITAAAGSNLSFYDSTGSNLSLDTGDINAGVITATTANFTNATVTGDLTVQGTTTTLDTTVTEVDKLEVGANNTTVGVAITQSGTGDILRLYDGASQVVTVADGGNVGIGTDNPGAKTHIDGTTNNTPLIVEASQNNRSRLVFRNNQETGTQCTIELIDEDLRFNTNSGERMRIVRDGNIGIGITNPTALLEVKPGSSGQGILLKTTANVFGTTKFDSNRTLESNYLGTIDYAWNGTTVAQIVGVAGDDTVNKDNGRIAFYTADAGSPAHRATIDSSGRLLLGVESSSVQMTQLLQGNSASGASYGTLYLARGVNNPSDGNFLGEINFSDNSHDSSASIRAVRDGGTWTSTSSQPSALIFETTSNSQSNPTERLRVDSSGRLLVGTNSAAGGEVLQANGVYPACFVRASTSGGPLINIKRTRGNLPNVYTAVQDGDNLGSIQWNGAYGSEYAVGATIEARADGQTWASGDCPGRLIFAVTRDGTSSPSTRMTILNTGEIRLGTTSQERVSTDNYHSIGDVNLAGNTSNLARLVMQERSGDWISFKNGYGTHYGTIAINGSGVSYGSNSDYRLKDNVENFSGGIDLVKQLRPVTFNWNELSGNEDTTSTQRGFLAHEVQEVEPSAVTGEKDEMDRYGDCYDAEGRRTQINVFKHQAKEGETWTLTSEHIRDQQLDPAKLVPILTAALKEAIGEIETLKARLDAAGL